MSRIASISIAAISVLTLSVGTVGATRSTSTASKSSLEVASGPLARSEIAVTWHQVPRSLAPAWSGFKTEASGEWETLWDSDTGVPHRIFGRGIHVPGSIKSPEIAERFAREFLARHIDLLAPGARPDDFIVVSNDLDAQGIRSIGMLQHYRGMRVIGGQVSFRFKYDRMAVIGSEALPYVTSPEPLATMDEGIASTRAVAWIQSDADKAELSGAVDGPFVLPIISTGKVTYHTVLRVPVAAEQPVGSWQVYVDAITGQQIARKQTLLFSSGTLLYDVPVRHPGATRENRPAQNVALMVNGQPVTSDDSGVVVWPETTPASVVTALSGPHILIENMNGTSSPTPSASKQLTLAPGGTTVWSESTEFADAQLTAFVHARVAQDYARRFAPTLPFLDTQLRVIVNRSEVCNAFANGAMKTINFFRANKVCQNTGRIADVVYHEFGHLVHSESIIEGVGAFDGAFSEGLSDFLAVSITGDPGMGRGFFLSEDLAEEPLRHLDPDGSENRWPQDIGEIHFTGLIFGSAMWDLRKELIVELGEAAGIARAEELYYAAVKRASSIPATYAEILLADDDDGDLSNGTPHECKINQIFGAKHGLRDLFADFVPIGVQEPASDNYNIDFGLRGLAVSRCLTDAVVSANLQWGLRSANNGTPNNIAMQASVAGSEQIFSAKVPKQASGETVRYKVVIKLVDGGSWSFPSNLAEPFYEFYVGDVKPLYCTTFDTDPFAEGWTSAITAGEPGNNDWKWGMLTSGTGRVDPPAPFSGDYVLGNSLGDDVRMGIYPNMTKSYVQMPSIDISVEGNKIYSDVRLQYRRWLTVEDAEFDKATIYANNNPVWRNLQTEEGAIHHLDTGWVFHDVPLSPGILDKSVDVKFELESDEGLEFGGWTMDDVCVVARTDAICGDGRLVGGEQCDDGESNSNTRPDACRLTCKKAFCGDSVVDKGEQCDFGKDNVANECGVTCRYLAGHEPSGCGCTASKLPDPVAPILVLGFLALLAGQRRRATRRGNSPR